MYRRMKNTCYIKAIYTQSALFLAMIPLLFLSGCMAVPYNLVMENVGAEELRDAKMVTNEYHFGIGWLMSGQRSIHSRPDVPFGESVDVYWARNDGQEEYGSNVRIGNDLPILKGKQWYEILITVDDNDEAKLNVLVCIPPYGPCK